VDRKKQLRGTSQYTAARDTSGELLKLDLVQGSHYARNAGQYETMKANKLTLTPDGRALIQGNRA